MDELRRLPPTAWILIGCAAALGFGTSWAWRWYRHYRARKALHAAVTSGTADHLIDSLVPDGMGGSFHIDFLLLTLRGVVVIDLRDVKGNIFGGDQMAEWTVMDGPRRFTFTNPQSALYDRIAAVKAVAGDVPVEGRIVFTRRPLSQRAAEVDADARCAARGISSGRVRGARRDRGALP